MVAKCSRLGSVFVALAMICALAPGASAVVVHSGGHFLGVTPRPGVAPAALPGSGAAAAATGAATGAGAVNSASYAWENLNYQGGPVLHSSAPYLVFWAPNGETIPSQSPIENYFSDVAADSTKATNVYAVGRQFTDATGFADYRQTFDPQTQLVADSDPYPTQRAAECSESSSAICVSDQQLQDELSSLITANALPSDGATGASELPSGAPIYFLVLPSDVDVCYVDGSCASNYFCAYHSSYADGPNNVLYAAIPTVALSSPQDPKGCQDDGNAAVQEPNGSLGDVALKYISHEDNETITDPLGSGWYSSWTGYENGDNCNDEYTNPSAFTPTLGGDAGAGTLYNQAIAGDHYYLQSEWSNGGSSCLMQASGGSIRPRFSVPAGPRSAGTGLPFDPKTSTSTYQISSETWDFGDGTTSFHAGRTLATATHAYATVGNYTVTLTLVDNRGELSTVSEPVSVGIGPTAAFTASTTQLPEGNGPVSFDASGSSTDAGASIDSYTWDFGDGSTASGASASHTYATAGTYLVRLTTTDSANNADTATTTITVVDEPPVAAFTLGAASPEVGQSVPFDGSSSSDSDGSIISYSWKFGDGHTASGRTPTHTYSSAGTYTVTLTVTDSSGQKSSATQQVTVVAGPSARFTASAGQAVERAPIAFDSGASAGGASGAAIVSYAWAFGDKSTATVANPSHAYGTPGLYTVKLTVTDAAGATASTTQQVTVVDEAPTAAFSVGPALPIPGGAVTFDGGASADPDGTIVSYAWDFGDGAAGTGETPTHAYANPGTYTVKLTVGDSGGAHATVSHPVTVYPVPQSGFSYTPSLPVERVATTFTAGASASDPGAMISSYAWSFGDGASASGATATHAFAYHGSYRVTLTVTNGFGLTTTTSEAVAVADAPPSPVVAVLTAHPAPGRPVTFGGGGSHDDDPIVSYLWRFGDRSGAVGRKLTHTFARAGSYRVSLTVRNSFGGTATTTVTVKVGRASANDKAHRSKRHAAHRAKARRPQRPNFR